MGGGSRAAFGGRGSTSAPDYVARYECLARWFSEHCVGENREVGWIRERYFSITGHELLLDSATKDTIERRGQAASEMVQRDAVAGNAPAREVELSREEIRSKLKLLKRKKKIK